MEVACLVTGSHDQSVSITICLETVATLIAIIIEKINSETMIGVLVKRLGNIFRRRSAEIASKLTFSRDRRGAARPSAVSHPATPTLTITYVRLYRGSRFLIVVVSVVGIGGREADTKDHWQL